MKNKTTTIQLLDNLPFDRTADKENYFFRPRKTQRPPKGDKEFALESNGYGRFASF
jgi:hypothetical protein